MFRTAVLRSAASAAARRSAAVATSRSFSSVVSRPTLAASKAVASPVLPVSRVAGWTAVRCYAAGSGLSKEDVEGRITSLLAGFDKVNDPSNIKPTAHFANDLGLDSLDTVEVVMAIEEEFSIEIPDKDADAIHSVDKAVEYILSQPDAH
ncbi:putative acyl carrier protein [Diaporthe ampelina]|uniref:Acyl carrier protein n=1 Tax=Diaporthe ampelina TaxID=1214573 RepID=A0A0G2I1U7_9PEZI|nr:putative acyl carrier protein [Diaporthe ampelina]